MKSRTGLCRDLPALSKRVDAEVARLKKGGKVKSKRTRKRQLRLLGDVKPMLDELKEFKEFKEREELAAPNARARNGYAKLLAKVIGKFVTYFTLDD